MRIVAKQITKFFIIGITAVLVDLVVYYFLSNFFVLNTDISKAFGFLTGSIYTYNLNKRWTWYNNEKSDKGMLSKFIAVYGFSFFMNILINKMGLTYIPDFVFSTQISSEKGVINLLAIKGNKFLAFVLATGSSAMFNFVGQKYFVFKGKINTKKPTA